MEERLLKRVEFSELGETIVRVCHRLKHKVGDAPCFGCVKRTQCNHEIFSKLVDYEDAGLSPKDVSDIVAIASERKKSRLTLSNSDGSVSQPTNTTVDSVFRKLAEYEDIGICPEDLAKIAKILRKE